MLGKSKAEHLGLRRVGRREALQNAALNDPVPAEQRAPCQMQVCSKSVCRSTTDRLGEPRREKVGRFKEMGQEGV